MDDETCTCGHVFDEHFDTIHINANVGGCTIEGCPCVYFEADGDD